MTDSDLGQTKLPRRRALLKGLVLLPLAPLGLVGCSRLIAAPEIPSTSPEPGAFPITIQHVFGETRIAKAPIRIATLGLGSNDACLSLGVVPTAMPKSNATTNGSTPWFDLALLDFGVVMPFLLDESRGLPTTELAGIGPDIILACNSSLTREDYAELSRIAPVVAYPGTPMSTDWQTLLSMVGKAIGRSETAEKVRVSTVESISTQLANYPDLKNTTFVYAKVRSALGADFEVFGPKTNPVRILGEFGIVPDPALGRVWTAGRPIHPDGSGPETYEWPRDRAAELAGDIAIFGVEHKEREGVLSNGLLTPVPAFVAKNFVLADLEDNGLALEAASPLSVQWLATNMLSQVAQVSYGAKQSS